MLYLPEQHNCIRFLLALKAFDNRRKNIHRSLLTSHDVLSYRLSVAPQWAIGRGNPYQYKATPDADCVFFIVVKSVPPIFSGADPRSINGGAGRAAFGLAGLLVRRYFHPCQCHHQS